MAKNEISCKEIKLLSETWGIERHPATNTETENGGEKKGNIQRSSLGTESTPRGAARGGYYLVIFISFCPFA